MQMLYDYTFISNYYKGNKLLNLLCCQCWFYFLFIRRCFDVCNYWWIYCRYCKLGEEEKDQCEFGANICHYLCCHGIGEYQPESVNLDSHF